MLIRNVVSRSEKDLATIMEVYKELYGTSLAKVRRVVACHVGLGWLKGIYGDEGEGTTRIKKRTFLFIDKTDKKNKNFFNTNIFKDFQKIFKSRLYFAEMHFFIKIVKMKILS